MATSHEEISNELLKTKQYSTELILKNIHNLNLWNILTTQKLTPEFCIKYLYLLNNNNFTKNDYDEEIYLHDILCYQSHIRENDLNHYINLYHNNKLYDNSIYTI